MDTERANGEHQAGCTRGNGHDVCNAQTIRSHFLELAHEGAVRQHAALVRRRDALYNSFEWGGRRTRKRDGMRECRFSTKKREQTQRHSPYRAPNHTGADR